MLAVMMTVRQSFMAVTNAVVMVNGHLSPIILSADICMKTFLKIQKLLSINDNIRKTLSWTSFCDLQLFQVFVIQVILHSAALRIFVRSNGYLFGWDSKILCWVWLKRSNVLVNCGGVLYLCFHSCIYIMKANLK